ncbi:hypothetical protein [Streptomyces sp. NPDC048442]|uniref:hypothetical protein n=1 Tax=Streptomyces sp. NPDC048442 TaxID=3154823 RepID=UPI0034146DF9
MDRYTSGAHSWRTAGGTKAAVADTNPDGTSPYTEYNRSAGGNTLYTLHNKSGSNTTAYSGAGSNIWDMRACTSWTGPDDCSVWWSDDH